MYILSRMSHECLFVISEVFKLFMKYFVSFWRYNFRGITNACPLPLAIWKPPLSFTMLWLVRLPKESLSKAFLVGFLQSRKFINCFPHTLDGGTESAELWRVKFFLFFWKKNQKNQSVHTKYILLSLWCYKLLVF